MPSPHASSCSQLSKLRAHEEDGDGTPLRRVVWQPRRDELEQAGASVVDGDIEVYRDDEFNTLED
jgi:hypothetical protein